MLSLFSLKGRTSRLGYWRVYLSTVIFGVVVWGGGLALMQVIGPVAAIVFLGLPLVLVVSLTTILRRLHDRGRGWVWWMLFVPAPIVLSAIAQVFVNPEDGSAAVAALPFSLAGLGFGLWGLVEIGFLPGQSTANRFGPAPVRAAGVRPFTAAWFA